MRKAAILCDGSPAGGGISGGLDHVVSSRPRIETPSRGGWIGGLVIIGGVVLLVTRGNSSPGG
ncbi:MAG: hypothetical protein P4L55_16250 [Syntrophobacteraceae bacterium]|nr:hypothetical protein [Syntrophobacteraceae bacterium]